MRWMFASWLIIAASGWATGCRVDTQLCDQACRNSASLRYWREADKEIAAAPAEQRDALRKQKLGEFSGKVDAGLAMCVNQCRSSRDPSTAECLAKAKTAEQSVACSD